MAELGIAGLLADCAVIGVLGARLLPQRREQFAAAVVAGVRLPLDFVRLNVSAIRDWAISEPRATGDVR